MENAPEVPVPMPPIPRGSLWIALAVPPLTTLVANLLVILIRNRNGDIAAFSMFVMLLVLFGMIPGFAFHYHDAVRHRYRGPSLGFLVFSYLFGQVIVCLAVWCGSCYLAFSLNP